MKSNPVVKLQPPSTVDPSIQAIADEIHLYLASHPTASDSLDGIGTQWLASKVATEQQVSAAVELLIAQGKLPKTFIRIKPQP